MAIKKQHGGTRTGAGRTRKEKDLRKRRNVSLTDETIKKAKRIGDGNISEGLTSAVKNYTKAGAK